MSATTKIEWKRGGHYGIEHGLDDGDEILAVVNEGVKYVYSLVFVDDGDRYFIVKGGNAVIPKNCVWMGDWSEVDCYVKVTDMELP